MTEQDTDTERLEELLARGGRAHRPRPGWQRKVWGVIDAPAPDTAQRLMWMWPPGWALAVLGAAAVLVGGLGGAGAYYVTKRPPESYEDMAAEVVEDFATTVSTKVESSPDRRVNLEQAEPPPSPQVAPAPSPRANREEPRTRGRDREVERAKPATKEKKATKLNCGADDPLCSAF